jgi:RNA 3'-terminal phosphate cyclase
MLVPYLGLAAGTSRIGITEVSSHLLTNMWVAEQILGCRMELRGEVGKSGVMQIHGVGMVTPSS